MGILYQTESFLTACTSLVAVWCMSQTSSDRNNSRRVRTHEKNLGETVPRLGAIIQTIFCAQSGAGVRLNFWKYSLRVGTLGLFHPYVKTFVAPFLPTQLTAPGSPRMPFIRFSLSSMQSSIGVMASTFNFMNKINDEKKFICLAINFLLTCISKQRLST